MKLICFLEDGQKIDIQPGVVTRDWMSKTPQSFVYRCLPLSIANGHGWEISSQHSFTAIWDGGIEKESIRITPENRGVISHFGSGVMTFHVTAVFRTEPGWNLMVMGPPNRLKPGIQALNAIVETDWSPYGFTMNWKFTHANEPVHFEKGEPFCFIFPVQRGAVDATEPEFRKMSSDAKLHGQNKQWVAARKQFMEDLSDPASEAAKQKWQQIYFNGLLPDGTKGIPDHQLKVKAKPFKNS
jgi:hypothetical protein